MQSLFSSDTRLLMAKIASKSMWVPYQSAGASGQENVSMLVMAVWWE